MPANPINTGDIDVTPIVLTASDTLYPNDRQGTLARIDSLPPGKSVDNIFFFSINGEYFRRVIDGPLRASHCKIYPNSGDQTANILAAVSAGLKEIVFDSPTGGTYFIEGALIIPIGVVFTFYAGCILGGGGVV